MSQATQCHSLYIYWTFAPLVGVSFISKNTSFFLEKNFQFQNSAAVLSWVQKSFLFHPKIVLQWVTHTKNLLFFKVRPTSHPSSQPMVASTPSTMPPKGNWNKGKGKTVATPSTAITNAELLQQELLTQQHAARKVLATAKLSRRDIIVEETKKALMAFLLRRVSWGCYNRSLCYWSCYALIYSWVFLITWLETQCPFRVSLYRLHDCFIVLLLWFHLSSGD